jgi:hypothetical protein
MIDKDITSESCSNLFLKNLLSPGANAEVLHGESWSKDANGVVGAPYDSRRLQRGWVKIKIQPQIGLPNM